MKFTVPQKGMRAGGKCPFYWATDQGICSFLESNRALHSCGTASNLQPTQTRMQLKERESDVQSQTFTMGDKRRIFYQPQGTVQTLLQHRKLLDGGQEEKKGPALP